MDDGESSSTMWVYLEPQNCAVKYGKDGMFDIMWLWPQQKDINNNNKKDSVHLLSSGLLALGSQLPYQVKEP